MSTTVEMGGFTVTGSEPSENVIASFTPSDPQAEQPKVTVKDGQPVTDEDAAKEKLSGAASELGKKGAEAAAAKRAAEKEAKEAVKEPTPPAEAPEDDLKGRAKARVEQVTREAAQLKREMAQLRAELAAERQRQAAPPQDPKAKPVNEDAEPQESDFEDYGKYVRAVARWEAKQELRQRETERHADTAAQEYNSAVGGAVKRYNERIAKEAAEDATLMDEVRPVMEYLVPSFELDDPKKYGSVHAIADEILASEIPGKLLRHFARNKEDFQRIASLRTQGNVLREMAKLEARLGATSGTPPPPSDPPSKVEVSKAPSPVRPVTGKPVTAPAGQYVEGMDFDQWLAKQPKR